jgi:hypothetical protein
LCPSSPCKLYLHSPRSHPNQKALASTSVKEIEIPVGVYGSV